MSIDNIDIDLEIEDVEDNTAIDIQQLDEKPEIPKMSDYEWTDYVMSHLESDEIYEILGNSPFLYKYEVREEPAASSVLSISMIDF